MRRRSLPHARARLVAASRRRPATGRPTTAPSGHRARHRRSACRAAAASARRPQARGRFAVHVRHRGDRGPDEAPLPAGWTSRQLLELRPAVRLPRGSPCRTDARAFDGDPVVGAARRLAQELPGSLRLTSIVRSASRSRTSGLAFRLAEQPIGEARSSAGEARRDAARTPGGRPPGAAFVRRASVRSRARRTPGPRGTRVGELPERRAEVRSERGGSEVVGEGRAERRGAPRASGDGHRGVKASDGRPRDDVVLATRVGAPPCVHAPPAHARSAGSRSGPSVGRARRGRRRRRSPRPSRGPRRSRRRAAAAGRLARRCMSTTQPSARIGRPTGPGLRNSTFSRAVTPQLSAADERPGHHLVEDRAHDPAVGDPVPALEPAASVELGPAALGSTWSSSCSPWSLSVPQAKQLCGANSNAASRRRSTPAASPSAVRATPQTSRFRTLRASALMKSLRGATFSPISFVKISSARAGVLDVDPQQGARLRVHRRLPELVGVHLAEALVALDRQVLDVELLDDPVALLLGLGVVA